MNIRESLKRCISWRVLATLLLLTLVITSMVGQAASPMGQAAPSAGYTLERRQVSAGGGAASGGGYQLSGATAGSESGKQAGGNYQLQGGFWQGSTYVISLPLVVR